MDRDNTNNLQLTENYNQISETNKQYELTIVTQQEQIKEKDILIKEHERILNNIFESLSAHLPSSLPHSPAGYSPPRLRLLTHSILTELTASPYSVI